VDAGDFSDVLDMEYLLLSDSSSVTDRNESRNSETNGECIVLCSHNQATKDFIF